MARAGPCPEAAGSMRVTDSRTFAYSSATGLALLSLLPMQRNQEHHEPQVVQVIMKGPRQEIRVSLAAQDRPHSRASGSRR